MGRNEVALEPQSVQFRGQVDAIDPLKYCAAHVSEFPVPREERIQVHRLLGIVLWHEEMTVALPDTACEHLAEITPQDFDRQFPIWLRLAGNPR